MNSISAITPRPLQPLSVPGLAGGVKQPTSEFKNLLIDSIRQVNEAQKSADNAVETLVTGGDVNPAEVLTAVQKADLSFRMMMQVRNKMIQAYQEIREIRI
jgi:flagellar hook-basal body complex protein FliE